MPDDITPAAGTDFTDSGAPTFEHVRDRVENRYTTAIGSTEIAAQSQEAAALDEKLAERDKQAGDKLEELRRSMNDD